MEKITLKEFDEVYALFEKAFIPAELRPYEKMKLLFLEDEFVIYGMYQDGRIIGAIIVWEFNDFVYLENFAVDQSLRGQGLGSQILQAIKELYPHQLLVFNQKTSGFLSKKSICFKSISFCSTTIKKECTESRIDVYELSRFYKCLCI